MTDCSSSIREIDMFASSNLKLRTLVMTDSQCFSKMLVTNSNLYSKPQEETVSSEVQKGYCYDFHRRLHSGREAG